MASLQLKDLLALLDGGAATVTAPADVATRAAHYAARVWSDCRLVGTPPPTIEYCALTKGSAKHLCHFNAGRKDCFLIVVCAAASDLPEAHILFDIGGQYRSITYTDLSTDFVGEPTEQMLANSLPRLREGGTPAAILESGEGSYLQTYQNGPDEFTLEYQLVTTAFHLVGTGPVTGQDVLRAFRSYAFGKYEWAKDYDWKHQPVP